MAHEDRIDAEAEHDADRPPTPDEERLAEGNSLDPDVEKNYEDALERGAGLKGEGAID